MIFRDWMISESYTRKPSQLWQDIKYLLTCLFLFAGILGLVWLTLSIPG